MISIYSKLFNIVFDTGIIPESWLTGIIRPVYKHNGKVDDPDNYRAITLISCLGKLFTSIINNRLTFLSYEFEIIYKNQSGFRKGFSTKNNIFIMHALVFIYFSFGVKLYCALISVRHSTLYGEMASGKNCFNMI